MMSDDFLLFWFFIHDCKYKTEHFPLNTEQENKKRKKHGSGNTIQISVLTEHSSITSYLASVLNVVSAMIYQRLNWSVHAANCLPPPPLGITYRGCPSLQSAGLLPHQVLRCCSHPQLLQSN